MPTARAEAAMVPPERTLHDNAIHILLSIGAVSANAGVAKLDTVTIHAKVI